ncbi:MAG: TetR/AcrR family transcriptional regulator [Ilumatobacteraceae bacterium]
MPAVPTTPKGRRTWQHLLQAARAVFARDGYVNARMADIAEEAGLSMGALYRYFENKESVFEHLVAGIHEELFTSSRAGGHRFASEPFEALREANLGYLRHYFENRDVMRTLVEAAAVDSHFRDIWWQMRNRHSQRFTEAVRDQFGITQVGGIDAAVAADAMTCMVEQVAYVWYGHEAIHDRKVDLEEAAEVTTRAWYRLFFAPDGWQDTPPPAKG